MWRLNTKRLLWISGLALKKIVESIFIVVTLLYVVLVFDIYINTEKLSKVNYPINAYCEYIARNPKFTKGPVVFRVDRGTLVFRLDSYISSSGLLGYTPFFIFPHHGTVIISENMVNSKYLDVLVVHELGHIQGGLSFLGKRVDMEKQANRFAIDVVGQERFNLYLKYLEELSKKEPQK